MGSPCEVLVDTAHEQRAQAAAEAVAACAARIEQKYSRYRDDNLIARINGAGGEPVTVDEETAKLLDFAALAWTLSDGAFDITSGVLRRAWKFDGGQQLPTEAQLRELLDLVGWSKVSWQKPVLRLLPGMQIDLGGVGKEYAVDLALGEARRWTDDPVLVNFGGDLAASGPRRDGPWRVGVESMHAAPGAAPQAARMVELNGGALATSGDTYRYVAANGQRLSHILDPRTGRPVAGAPRCVTVAAPTCLLAGMYTTLAMLKGPEAEDFLRREAVRHWVQRDDQLRSFSASA